MSERKETKNSRWNATITATQERWTCVWLCTQPILDGVSAIPVVCNRPTYGLIRPSVALHIVSIGKLEEKHFLLQSHMCVC